VFKDLWIDPRELNNVFDDPACATPRKVLMALLMSRAEYLLLNQTVVGQGAK